MQKTVIRLAIAPCLCWLLPLLALGAPTQAHTPLPPSEEVIPKQERTPQEQPHAEGLVDEKASLTYFVQSLVGLLIRITLAALITGLVGAAAGLLGVLVLAAWNQYIKSSPRYSCPESRTIWDFAPVFDGLTLGAETGALLGLLLAGYFLVSSAGKPSPAEPASEEQPAA